MTLEQIYLISLDVSDVNNIDAQVKTYIWSIAESCAKKKGLYTVLTTLLYYKHLHPEQDIRFFQKSMGDGKGFSARSFDTNNVTPVLRTLGLPAMAESGWLTRSLEQPYPYDMNYNGKIGVLKEPFLKTIDYLQDNPNKAVNMLRILLNKADEVAKASVIQIIPLQDPEHLTIDKIINALTEHFSTNYNTHGGAKLPVLAFHSIYLSLVNELKRYDGCSLADLSSLTACDATNKASGDVEVLKGNNHFETVEIKLDRKITSDMVREIKEKIYRWNPHRYYVLSTSGIEEKDRDEINIIVKEVFENHGCQIIINGLIPTIKYYLRLISNLCDFVDNYSTSVEIDNELQKEHKEKWNELIKKYKL